MNNSLFTNYVAVRHVLTSPSISRRTAPYIGRNDFDWNGLLREAQTMSTGEDVLVRIAQDLWQPKGAVAVWELARRLDGRSFGRVVEALAISRGELDPEAVALEPAA